MNIAYADPPYPGCAHLYRDHPDYAGEVDHVELVARLQTYDGWALSTSSKALREVLALCPADSRVIVWVKNTVRYAWEPVIVSPARKPTGLRDWIHCETEGFQWRPKPDGYVIGQKPEPFCMWVFDWLGARPDDDLDDLYPGSGAVARAWHQFATQARIVIPEAPNKRATTRAAARALKAHPTIDAA